MPEPPVMFLDSLSVDRLTIAQRQLLEQRYRLIELADKAPRVPPNAATGSFLVTTGQRHLAACEAQGLTCLLVLEESTFDLLESIPGHYPAFHSLTEAIAWALAHPDGNAYLKAAIASGARLLREGGLVAFPTETVYGLGANALDAKAVNRIFTAKQRPSHDPLIVHITERDQLAALVSSIPAEAEKLMAAFWPGPLTLVMPKRPAVPDAVTSGHPTVAVRMTANPWAMDLIRQAGVPVAAPSANLFGRTSPTTAQHVDEQLGDRCDLIIDAGACRVGVESTVLSVVGEQPLLLRSGGLSREALESVIGPVAQPGEAAAVDHHSPGMLPSHYAPQTPLRLVTSLADYADRPDVGILLFQPTGLTFAGPVEQLSARGDVAEAAIKLYAAIRRLDALDLRLIVAERVPGAGIGSAINDRLERAAWSPHEPEP